MQTDARNVHGATPRDGSVQCCHGDCVIAGDGPLSSLEEDLART